MARFHFDLVRGAEVIRDDVGVDAVDLDLAVIEAQDCIDEMRMRGELDELDTCWSLAVRGQGGVVHRRIPIH